MLNLMRACLRPIGQWAVIGLHGPQGIITAELNSNARTRDVSRSHSVAALDPLTVAIAGSASIDRGRLIYRDSETGSELGWLELARVGAIDDIGLFQLCGGDHRCVGWPLRPWNRVLQARAQKRQREKPRGFTMSPDAVAQLMIAYIPPRPVVLVSVVGPNHGNLFPMDLIGEIGDNRFALALRRSSASTDVMRDHGRVALSDAPAAKKGAVYALGGNHQRAVIDWNGLPFSISPTSRFGIPAIADGLRVRELAIQRAQDIGSHRLFVGSIVSDEVTGDGAQLHHTAGFHQYYRERRGKALPTA